MKKTIVTLITMISLFSVGHAQTQKRLSPIQETANAKAEKKVRKIISGDFVVDPAHTRVSFIVPHLVVSEVEGRFNDVKGSFKIPDKITGATFNATVPVASIDTGNAKRDEDLRSENFFDAKKYPEMKFESKSITGTLDNFKMVVSLTIKDVTKDVLFTGTYSGAFTDQDGKTRVGLKANGNINRRDFHINYARFVDRNPIVGDQVEIKIIAEGVKI